MNNNLVLFENPEFGKVRTLNIDNEPWFVGKDVAEALGYVNASKAVLTHVDDEDKTFTMLNIADSQNGNVSAGQTKTAIINESGLYSLVLSSKLSNAKKFKRWVTSEILPSIRKTGSYNIEQIINNPEFGIKLLTEIKTEREKNQLLLAENAEQQKVIKEQKPKVEYYDTVLQSPDLITTNSIAKDYGKSAVWLNKILANKGVQYRQGEIWYLYQAYADKGYAKQKTTIIRDGDIEHIKVWTYWTQAGKKFIYDLLKQDGILPIVDYYKQEKEAKKKRQMEGIEAARNKGVVFGRPGVTKPDNWEEIVTDWKSGKITAKKAMELSNMKKSTFYKNLKQSQCE